MKVPQITEALRHVEEALANPALAPADRDRYVRLREFMLVKMREHPESHAQAPVREGPSMRPAPEVAREIEDLLGLDHLTQEDRDALAELLRRVKALGSAEVQGHFVTIRRPITDPKAGKD